MIRFINVICISTVASMLGCEAAERTYVFNVPDMMCAEGCGAATQEILLDQNGVKDVKVDFPAKIVTVVASEKEFDSNGALDELIDHGFDNSSIKKSAGN
jgi:copper chaperone CopZ